jgi:hypothetical protein
MLHNAAGRLVQAARFVILGNRKRSARLMGTRAMGKAASNPASGRPRAWTVVAMLTLMVLALTAPARANTIDGGAHHSLGVKADGTVAAWGYNNYGQCNVPAGLSGVVAVAAGSWHSLALKSDGTVAAWGNTDDGKCTVPTDLNGVAAVAGGYLHNLALKADGTVVAWGWNGYDQCTVPTGLSGVVAVAAGTLHSLAVKGDGTVVAWGDNTYGQCTVPAGLSGVVAVSGGHMHSLALKADGTVVVWGSNPYGQLDITPGLSEVVAAYAGVYHNLALKADGTVVIWGDNHQGQLTIPQGLSGMVAVACGDYHSHALKSDGSLVVWGYDYYNNITPPAGVTFMVPGINRPPLANAGDNYNILSKDQATTILPGTASDADSDALTYRWMEGETALTNWQPVTGGQAPLDLGTVSLFSLGQHNLTLEVKDGKVLLPSRDTMALIVGNSAPNSAPSGGGDYIVNTPVRLGGQVSDFDGDPLTYRWLKGTVELTTGAVTGIQGGEPINLTPFLVSNLPVGEHELTLEVSDGTNPPVSQSVKVRIIEDTTAPTLAPVADKTILWPPDKKMVTVTILANAGDNSGLPVTLTASVSCNEPNAGAPYWTVPLINQDTGIITVQLQADRLGKGKGRMYTIGITATDQFGNTSSAQVVVSVPHDQGNK